MASDNSRMMFVNLAVNMYGRSFQDLDGHLWEVFWMDPGAVGQ